MCLYGKIIKIAQQGLLFVLWGLGHLSIQVTVKAWREQSVSLDFFIFLEVKVLIWMFTFLFLKFPVLQIYYFTVFYVLGCIHWFWVSEGSYVLARFKWALL